MSGDEADGEKTRPRIRDFGNQRGESSKSPDRKKKKKAKKHSKKKHRHQETEPTDDLKDIEAGTANADSSYNPQVNFADEVEVVDNNGTLSTKRPRGLRQISLRPQLPQTVLNSVFFAPPPEPSASPSIPPPRIPRVAHSKLRRTTSLPERMNKAQSWRQDPIMKQLSGTGNSVHTESAEVAPEAVEQEEVMSRTAAVMLLLISTGLVAVCAEFLVDAIPEMTTSGVSQAFIALIILPIVGNAAEHVTAVTVAAKNKMDLAIGVAVGSSIQIAIFVTPLVVLLGWMMNKEMTLYFNIFETVSLFVTAFVVNFLVLDGRSNYLEGALLMAAYCIIAICAFFYPDDGQSDLGGGDDSSGAARFVIRSIAGMFAK